MISLRQNCLFQSTSVSFTEYFFLIDLGPVQTPYTSHVPYQVVRSFLAVVRCPNEFFSTDFN